ncbi:MAG: mechanosensitive ion channel family protein [Deltaproteobacteria bacterium]|nr:mechanosensitive ion channel family protein [Deltaproteobacteria bacterium]
MKKIDKAGEALGKGIERFSEKASTHVGGWINTEVFAGITWLKLSFCLLLVFLVVAVELVLRWLIRAHMRRIPPEEDVVSWRSLLLTALSRPLSLFVWVYGIYGALSPLFIHFQTPEGTNLVHLVAQKAADIGGAFAVLWFIYRLVDVIDARIRSWVATTESTIDDIVAPLVGKTLRIFIIIIGSVIILQNLTGLKIGPLLASLGIGGLAVALAARDSIANFFGTLTILFDKPFQVGERIVIDNYDGVVESVGFRSSRIRTLTGHLVSIPNEKVVNSTSENIARRPFIRWLTNIGITYDTSPEKAEQAVQIIGEILENHEGMNEEFPPRVYFNGFNDWNLNILVLAWYHPPNYWDYQAWLQRTCLEIMRRFEAEGIDFAFPTQTVYVANDDKRQLKLQMMGEKGLM